MKHIILFLGLALSNMFCFAQEVKIHSNGLIYNDSSMKQLALIVDSLNLKFKSSDLHKTYYSLSQANAHYFSLDKGEIKAAKEDIEKGISFEEFAIKYPEAVIDKDVLVAREERVNYKDELMVLFIDLINQHSVYLRKTEENAYDSVKDKCLFMYEEGGSYVDESLNGFFFTTELKTEKLVEKYARMVLYADYMIDTSSQIFKEDALESTLLYRPKEHSAIQAFWDYIYEETDKPEYDKDNFEAYVVQKAIWDSLKLEIIESRLSTQKEFQTLFKEAIKEALEEGGSDDEFEEYVWRYDSPKIALELKRGRMASGSRKVFPRVHRMNIALLAAETATWDIFLQAHLSILTDQFDRVNEGSYAWPERKTFMRELEELGIDVSSLLLGTLLQIEEPSSGHYFGNAIFLGQALAETQYPAEIEDQILSMIQDESLDDLNRIAMYILFTITT